MAQGEEIVAKLRQAEVLAAKAKAVAEAVRSIGVTGSRAIRVVERAESVETTVPPVRPSWAGLAHPVRRVVRDRRVPRRFARG